MQRIKGCEDGGSSEQNRYVMMINRKIIKTMILVKDPKEEYSKEDHSSLHKVYYMGLAVGKRSWM